MIDYTFNFNLCPFCGNRSVTMYGLAVIEQSCDDGSKYTWVKCNKCCAEGPHVPIRKNQCAASMIRKATDAWNERHYIAPPGSEIPKGKSRPRDELGAKKFKEV